MRSTLLKLSLLAVLAAPIAAHAEALDLITVTDQGTVYTYLVPASPTASEFNTVINSSYSFFSAIELPLATTTINAGAVTRDDVFFGTTNCDQSSIHCSPGGLVDGSILPTNLALFGTSLFSYTSTTVNNVTTYFPTFNLTNNGTLLDPTGPNGGVSASYSIVAVATAGPVPEPSSLLLLGTGVLGVAGTLRRRLFA